MNLEPLELGCVRACVRTCLRGVILALVNVRDLIYTQQSNHLELRM